MGESPRGLRAFTKVWESFNLETVAAGRFEPDRTITVDYLQAAPTDELSSLPILSMSSAEGADLQIEGGLGKGGTAVVELAIQRSLDREVAVKRNRRTLQSRETTWKLLQEAWITGRLEHPNIVPVHVLGRTEDGAAVIVMKRIEGRSWRAFIRGTTAPPGEGFLEDPLGWHLGILMTVCQAIEFAHSRGIVHRDIKPDNVMVGAFGEVYVVDWGIAVSLEPDPRGRLPYVRDVRGIAGTPAYMAPEMAAGQNGAIDERTDVYLLGATLFEVLTGSAPHQRETLFDTLFSAFSGEPFDALEDAPQELGDICKKAMQALPKDRYPSVAAFREAVARFLQHRHSRSVARQARRRLEELQSILASIENAPRNLVKVQDLFGQCRFGFQEALREWSENPEARQGLDEAVACMARFEIARGDVEAASALLTQLSPPDNDLERELEALKRRLARERENVEALQELKRDLDLEPGSRARRILFPAALLSWTILPAAASVIQRTTTLSFTVMHQVIASVIMLVIVGGVVWWRREALLQNLASRGMMILAILVLVGYLLIGIGSLRAGLSLGETIGFALMLLAIAVSMIAATINWRAWVMGVTYWVGAVVALMVPNWGLETLAACNLLGTLGMEYFLRRWPVSAPVASGDEKRPLLLWF